MVIWRLLLLEIVAAIIVLSVWFLAPLVHIESIFWRILIILAILLPPIGIIIWKYLKARRASNGLEAAMSEQGKFEQESVRPDRREEIQALHSAFNQAIAALKRSRLGKGRGTALYALPWYMIIGPSAVGKSTALLHSGLKFPFTTGNRKAIKGLGGTRNCDWWFSDQAILLDTAGRYASEEEDQEEWLSFLRMLKKYRRKRPLNGLIVAASIADLITDKPEAVEELAAQLRERIDQVIDELDVALPVYLLFTKCDLISGFVPFFGDLSKSARSQVLGFTVPLTTIASDIEQIFCTEFNTLVERLQTRALSRIASAKSQERGAIFQFPLQFSAIRETLATFTSQLMMANPYVEMPRLRGVYFCSGTQEGKPVNTVMSMMSRALGLRELLSEHFEQHITKKSYFLRDVFTQVMFPDQYLAATSAVGKSRRKRLEVIALAICLVLSASFLGSATISFRNNKEFTASLVNIVQRSRIAAPDDPRRMLDSLMALEKVGQRLDQLATFSKEGPPLSMGLGFYQGNYFLDPLSKLYLLRMRQAFVLPVGSELEATLSDISNTVDNSTNGADNDFDLLKVYLMLTDTSKLDIPFAIPSLLAQWKKRLHPDVAQREEMLTNNTRRYLGLLKSGATQWLERDADLVNRVRHALRGRDAEYRHLVANLDNQIRPFTLRDALRGRVQTILNSTADVPGIYTRSGWTQHMQQRIARQLASGSKVEPWVLGEAENQGAAERLRERYFEQYIIAWQRFLKGISLQSVNSAVDAMHTLDKLTEPPPLYQELFSAIAYNTELPLIDIKLSKIATGKNRPISTSLSKKTMTPVERAFLPLKELVSVSSSIDGRPLIPGIQQYQAQLEAVKEALAKDAKGDFSNANGTDGLEKTLDEALHVTKGILATLPGNLRRLVAPFFYAPLENASQNARTARAHRAASSFNDELCAYFKDKLAGRYPFESSSQDALLQDVVEYFSPKGIVWTYYNDNFKNSVIRKGDNFKLAPGKNVPASIIDFLNQAGRITRAFFPNGSDSLKVRFQMRPRPAVLESEASAQVSEIAFEIEGKKYTYRNGPTEQWNVEWVGQDKRARLLVRGSGGLREEIMGQGDWALLRLFEQGTFNQRGNVYSVEWSINEGKIKIPVDINLERSSNPFFMTMRLTCQ